MIPVSWSFLSPPIKEEEEACIFGRRRGGGRVGGRAQPKQLLPNCQ